MGKLLHGKKPPDGLRRLSWIYYYFSTADFRMASRGNINQGSNQLMQAASFLSG